MSNKQFQQEHEDICAQCIHNEPGYVSVIGICDNLCHRHWHCKPGGDHLDFAPKQKEALASERYS